MRIGIISDTHGDTRALQEGLRVLGPIDALVHLGDHGDDIFRASGLPKEVHTLRGNTDGGLALPEEVQVQWMGYKALLTHGHRYGVKTGLQKLYYRGLEVGARFVLFGHTHQSCFQDEGDVVLVNPGSPSRPWPGQLPSVALLELTPDEWRVQIIPL